MLGCVTLALLALALLALALLALALLARAAKLLLRAKRAQLELGMSALICRRTMARVGLRAAS
jgi:hypothetical protein